MNMQGMNWGKLLISAAPSLKALPVDGGWSIIGF
jgi:hypothetical protein